MGFFSKEKVTTKEIAEFLIELSNNSQFIDGLKKINEKILIGKEQYKELLVFSMMPIIVTVHSVFGNTQKTQDIIDRVYTDIVHNNFKDEEAQNQFNIFFNNRKNEYTEIYNTEKSEDKFYPWAKFFCKNFFEKEEDRNSIVNITSARGILSVRLITAKEFLDSVLKKFNIV